MINNILANPDREIDYGQKACDIIPKPKSSFLDEWIRNYGDCVSLSGMQGTSPRYVNSIRTAKGIGFIDPEVTLGSTVEEILQDMKKKPLNKSPSSPRP